MASGSAVSFSGDNHVLGLGSSDTCRDRKPLRRPRQMRDCLGSDTRPESGSRERGIARGRRRAGASPEATTVRVSTATVISPFAITQLAKANTRLL